MGPGLSASALPGVRVITLIPHVDDRGSLTEVHRDAWGLGPHPLQWNLVRSRPRTLRGIHVHVRHTDYLLAVEGELLVALCDLRRASPAFGRSEVVRLRADEARAIVTPPGVAHGFYHPVPTTHLYSTSEYWRPEEEMGCHWSDPELGLTWTVDAPVLSGRDAALGSRADLLRQLEPFQDNLR